MPHLEEELVSVFRRAKKTLDSSADRISHVLTDALYFLAAPVFCRSSIGIEQSGVSICGGSLCSPERIDSRRSASGGVQFGD
jgi:hypothetical protein